MPRLPPSPLLLSLHSYPSLPFNSFICSRCISTTLRRNATPLPVTAAGPPPQAPEPAVSSARSRVDRLRRQAELLKRAEALRASNNTARNPTNPQSLKPGQALKRRFWKEVRVEKDKAETNALRVHLDTRPVRSPASKTPLNIPLSKPQLADAIALEWDLLTSAAQALKQHHIPLTSLAARARDIEAQDSTTIETSRASTEKSENASTTAREEIVKMLMRYLDTDTLLCWAPVKSGAGEASGLEQELNSASDSTTSSHISNQDKKSRSLRDLQIAHARPIISYLTSYIWPGIEIIPVLGEEGTIIPATQPQATRDVIRGWVSGLGAWELAGLERAVLASKSLCVGVRLVVEWGEGFRDVREAIEEEGRRLERAASEGEGSEFEGRRFGIEEAAEACSLEVSWQTGMWGEVEDSHDVEKEDLRRQLGSVVLLVSGRGER